MTPVDYLPLFTEVFGAQLIEPSKLPRASHSGFSGSTTYGHWIEWRDGEIVRAGSIGELHSIYNEVKVNGDGSDLRPALEEWDRRSMARAEDEAAAIVRNILIEELTPHQDKSGIWWLDLGPVMVGVEPGDSTDELARLAIREFEDLGIHLPHFEVGRKFTKEEIARVRASLPRPEDPTQPQHENQAAERPGPVTDDAADRPVFPEPDSNQFEIFIEGAFRYCDLNGVVSL